ncbi:hypothetical protein [Lactobacillus xylocopicola]|uniref:hypothetical protein n=1 Tax=Lactobacillus xylocopicola TaxID=2976676 RepID=UPI002954127C|nr:hypothetical protein [Lactobacillus xylocopicola]
MCGLAASSTFQIDQHSHLLDSILAKQTQREYLLSTTASSFVVGGTVGVLPLLVEAAYFFAKYGLAKRSIGAGVQLLKPTGWGDGLFAHHALLFLLCVILITFIFGGVYGLTGLVASYYDIPNGFEMVVPFALSCATWLLAGLSFPCPIC